MFNKSLFASEVVLDGASDSTFVGELFTYYAILRERTANSFTDAANASLSLELLANGTILVEHRLLVALHLLSCRLGSASYSAT